MLLTISAGEGREAAENELGVQMNKCSKIQ